MLAAGAPSYGTPAAPLGCQVGVVSEQLPQFLRGHANDGQDIPQRPFCHVASSVHGYGDSPPIGMAHYVVATAYSHDIEAHSLKCFDHLRPR